jgi:hypothetical protein
LALPTQVQYELFGTWLATVAKRGDNPFKKSSFQQYMRHMATLFEADFPPPCLNVARSPRSARFIAAVSRSLDSTKQRARPVQIADLYLFCSRLPLYYSPVLAKLARVIALVTFWGCLRLGTILQDATSLLKVITWRDFYLSKNLIRKKKKKKKKKMIVRKGGRERGDVCAPTAMQALMLFSKASFVFRAL